MVALLRSGNEGRLTPRFAQSARQPAGCPQIARFESLGEPRIARGELRFAIAVLPTGRTAAIDERARALQVSCLKTLREAAVDRREKFVCFLRPAPLI